MVAVVREHPWLLPGRSCQRARYEPLTDVECGRRSYDYGNVSDLEHCRGDHWSSACGYRGIFGRAMLAPTVFGIFAGLQQIPHLRLSPAFHIRPRFARPPCALRSTRSAALTARWAVIHYRRLRFAYPGRRYAPSALKRAINYNLGHCSTEQRKRKVIFRKIVAKKRLLRYTIKV